MNIRAHVLLIAILLIPRSALAQDDLSLYDERGNAVAYVALNDGRTIFLWGGKPVAYLEGDDPDIQEVYGFNGRRLGLLTAGLIIDKDGKTLCATATAVGATQPDPPKGEMVHALQGLPEIRTSAHTADIHLVRAQLRDVAVRWARVTSDNVVTPNPRNRFSRAK